MSNFITNAGNASLKSRLSVLINESQELRFLVGFFYFSRISELHESMAANAYDKERIIENQKAISLYKYLSGNIGITNDKFNLSLYEFVIQWYSMLVELRIKRYQKRSDVCG